MTDEDDSRWDDDEDLGTGGLFSGPTTRPGTWSVRFAALFMAFLLLFYLFVFEGVLAWGGEGAVSWARWVSLGPAGLFGAGAALTGIWALMGEERSLLVYLSASLGATIAVMVGVELLSWAPSA